MKLKKNVLFIFMLFFLFITSSCANSETKSPNINAYEAYTQCLKKASINNDDIVVASADEVTKNKYIVSLETLNDSITYDVDLANDKIEESSSTSDTQAIQGSIVNAYNLAFEASKLTEEDINMVNISLKNVKDTLCYEVELITLSEKYRYTINPKTNQIIESKIVMLNDDQTSSYIDKDLVIDNVLSILEINKENISNIIIKDDRKDGNKVYKLSFTYNNFNYDIIINSITGDIIRFEISTNDYNEIEKEDNLESDVISIDEVKEEICNYFSINIKDVKFNQIKLHKKCYDTFYEVKFSCFGYSYELEMNAYTKEIEDFEMIDGYYNQDDKPNHNHHDYLNEKDVYKKAQEHFGFDDRNHYYSCFIDNYNGSLAYYFSIVDNDIFYECYIDIYTGEILAENKEEIENKNEIISTSEAIDIALKHSCFTMNQVRIIEVELDDNVYYVVFQNRSIIYEYEIDAYTKEILYYDVDYW